MSLPFNLQPLNTCTQQRHLCPTHRDARVSHMCTPKEGRLEHRGNSPEEYEGSTRRSSYWWQQLSHSPREAGSSRGGGQVTPASWPQWLSPSQTVESGGRGACDSIPSGTEAPAALTPCPEQRPCKDDNPRHSKGNLAPTPPACGRACGLSAPGHSRSSHHPSVPGGNAGNPQQQHISKVNGQHL